MRQLVIALLLLASPVAVLADDPAFELTVFTGYRYGGEFEDFDGDIFEPDQEIEDSEVLGAIATFPINHNFHVELLYSVQDSELQFDGGLLEPPVEISDIELSYLQAGVVWQWLPGQVRPFVGASLGLARLAPDIPQVDTETRLAGSVNGGVKLFFTDHLGIRLEGRAYWVDLNDYEYRDRFGRRYEEEDNFYQLDATAGLVISF